METLSIGQLSEATAVPASTIRYYEERQLVLPVGRESGRRRYNESAIRRLNLVRLCVDVGFTLDECRMLLADREANRDASREIALRKLREVDEQIQTLQEARVVIEFGLACKCPNLEDCSCGTGLELV